MRFAPKFRFGAPVLAVPATQQSPAEGSGSFLRKIKRNRKGGFRFGQKLRRKRTKSSRKRWPTTGSASAIESPDFAEPAQKNKALSFGYYAKKTQEAIRKLEHFENSLATKLELSKTMSQFPRLAPKASTSKESEKLDNEVSDEVEVKDYENVEAPENLEPFGNPEAPNYTPEYFPYVAKVVRAWGRCRGVAMEWSQKVSDLAADLAGDEFWSPESAESDLQWQPGYGPDLYLTEVNNAKKHREDMLRGVTVVAAAKKKEESLEELRALEAFYMREEAGVFLRRPGKKSVSVVIGGHDMEVVPICEPGSAQSSLGWAPDAITKLVNTPESRDEQSMESEADSSADDTDEEDYNTRAHSRMLHYVGNDANSGNECSKSSTAEYEPLQLVESGQSYSAISDWGETDEITQPDSATKVEEIVQQPKGFLKELKLVKRRFSRADTPAQDNTPAPATVSHTAPKAETRSWTSSFLEAEQQLETAEACGPQDSGSFKVTFRKQRRTQAGMGPQIRTPPATLWVALSLDKMAQCKRFRSELFDDHFSLFHSAKNNLREAFLFGELALEVANHTARGCGMEASATPKVSFKESVSIIRPKTALFSKLARNLITRNNGKKTILKACATSSFAAMSWVDFSQPLTELQRVAMDKQMWAKVAACQQQVAAVKQNPNLAAQAQILFDECFVFARENYATVGRTQVLDYISRLTDIRKETFSVFDMLIGTGYEYANMLESFASTEKTSSSLNTALAKVATLAHALENTSSLLDGVQHAILQLRHGFSQHVRPMVNLAQTAVISRMELADSYHEFRQIRGAGKDVEFDRLAMESELLIERMELFQVSTFHTALADLQVSYEMVNDVKNDLTLHLTKIMSRITEAREQTFRGPRAFAACHSALSTQSAISRFSAKSATSAASALRLARYDSPLSGDVYELLRGDSHAEATFSQQTADSMDASMLSEFCHSALLGEAASVTIVSAA